MSVQAQKSINLKSIALPAEHGAWGFLLEPMLAGLIAASSGAGILFCVAMFGAFLIHQPLRIAVKDHLKQRRTPRTAYAEKFVLLYGLIAGLPLVLILWNQEVKFLLPLLMAFPLVLIQLYFDASNDSRHLAAEIAGSVALGAIAPAIVMLDNESLSQGMILWLLLTSRTIPSILYVRARLRLERGKPAAIFPAHLSHVLALVGVGVLLIAGYQVILPLIMMVVLLARDLWGLSEYRTPIKRPAIIGVQELIYGVLTAIAAGLFLV